jgi:hypothetical protein
MGCLCVASEIKLYDSYEYLGFGAQFQTDLFLMKYAKLLILLF